jgi:ABC-type bacteriocin/lantibiotic exporter with double-glycine peptidase domain
VVARRAWCSSLFGGLARFRVAAAEARAYGRWAAGFEATRRVAYRKDPARQSLVVRDAVFPSLATLVVYAAVTRGGVIYLTAGTFIAFMAAFGAVVGGVYAINRIVIAMVEVITLYERVTPILRATPEVDSGGRAPGRLHGGIGLHRVSFRYSPVGPLVLDDVSFEVKPGESVAIVGPSGSGKSTVLRLLLGFERPDSGRVTYDDQDLTELDLRALRFQLGVVLQSGSVMPGSILDNIAGSSNLSVADAWSAAEQAGLADDIRRLPMGMYTVVSEGGSTFSGGERQRLLIARALARRPRILFFDEATSALDNTTQAIVNRSLAHLDITRVVIAHRLSTICAADRIVVMDHGRVVQSGRYAELCQTPGLFRDLGEAQLTSI